MFIKKAGTCIPYETRGFPRLQKPKKEHIFYREVSESKKLPNFQRFLKTKNNCSKLHYFVENS
jgi:hypothetical protein